MKHLLLALVACSKREPHDDRPVVTPAHAIEVRCALAKPGEPPPGDPATLAGKRVWLYDNNHAITVTGEQGLIAAITPPEPRIQVSGGAAVAHGLAIVAHGKSTWYLAQLDLGGAPRGAPLALSGIAPEVGRIRVEAFADTVVLLEESAKGVVLQAYSLEAQPVGDPLDLGAVTVDDLARIGTSHAFLVRYRQYSNETAKLRIYDGDAHAWAGPLLDVSALRLAGFAPFGDALLLVGSDGDHVVAATLDAKGNQSPAKPLVAHEAFSVEPPLGGPDGAHAYAVWITDEKTVHVAQVLPELRLGPDVAFPGDGGNPKTNVASDATIYLNGQRIGCR